MLQFDVTHALPFLPENWLSSRLDGLTEARNLLERGNGLGGAFTGWVDLPASYDPEELQRILQTARIIRGQSEVLIVIGIGGSYLGARAMLELLTSPNYNLLRKKTPQIFFTGNTLSSDALTELLDYVRDKDFSVNVISKSGDTTESSIAFFLFRRLLEEKYGREGARDRIFATTDRREGTLRALANVITTTRATVRMARIAPGTVHRAPLVKRAAPFLTTGCCVSLVSFFPLVSFFRNFFFWAGASGAAIFRAPVPS